MLNDRERTAPEAFLRLVVATYIEGVEGIGAVGTMFKEVLLVLRQFLPRLVFAESLCRAYDGS